MRFRLRTLLIVLALGPPGLAVVWMLAVGERVHPILLGAAGYMGLVLVLITASWTFEVAGNSRIGRFFRLRTSPTGKCSYCGEARRPLAEGIAGVLICRDCAAACVDLIDQELQKQSRPTDSLPNAL